MNSATSNEIINYHYFVCAQCSPYIVLILPSVVHVTDIYIYIEKESNKYILSDLRGRIKGNLSAL